MPNPDEPVEIDEPFFDGGTPLDELPTVDTVTTGTAAAAPAQEEKFKIYKSYKAHTVKDDLYHRLRADDPLVLVTEDRRDKPKNFWNGNRFGGNDAFQTMNNSEPMSFQLAFGYVGTASGWSYHLVELSPLPEGKKSLMADHFSANLIELIKISPDNPVVRAHMMRILKVGVPDELKGYEALVGWVESTFSRRIQRNDPIYGRNSPAPPRDTWVVPDDMRRQALGIQVNAQPLAPMPVDPQPPLPTIAMTVRKREVQRGRCRYAENVTRRGAVGFNIEYIALVIDEGGVEGIGSLASDMLNSNRASETMDGWDGVHTDIECINKEVDEHDEEYREILDRAAFEQSLREFITQQDPELMNIMQQNQLENE